MGVFFYERINQRLTTDQRYAPQDKPQVGGH